MAFPHCRIDIYICQKWVRMSNILSESPSIWPPSSQWFSERWVFYTHTSWFPLPPQSWQGSGEERGGHRETLKGWKMTVRCTTVCVCLFYLRWLHVENFGDPPLKYKKHHMIQNTVTRIKPQPYTLLQTQDWPAWWESVGCWRWGQQSRTSPAPWCCWHWLHWWGTCSCHQLPPYRKTVTTVLVFTLHK